MVSAFTKLAYIKYKCGVLRNCKYLIKYKTYTRQLDYYNLN